MPSINRASDAELLVSYPAPEIHQRLTQSDYDFIQFAGTQYKVKVIKYIKAQYNLDLRGAKVIVDVVLDPQYKTIYQIT